MFESITVPRIGPKQPSRFEHVSGGQVVDIRADKEELQLRDSLQEGIDAACNNNNDDDGRTGEAAEAEAVFPDLLLWDKQGLKYFEDVTHCESYYLTKDEIRVLERNRYQIAMRIQPGSMLVELGSGNLRKTKIILDTLDELGREVDYFALDVSLPELRRTLCLVPPGIYRHVRCFGLLGTYNDGRRWLQQHPDIKSRPKTLLFLGSTLGNFEKRDAAAFLRSCVAEQEEKVGGSGGGGSSSKFSFLLGLDGCKDPRRVLRAYNDRDGVNHRFVRNGLVRANEILGSEAFDAEKWGIVGHWDEEGGVHKQYYYPRADVVFGEGVIPAGKRILAVKSHKYDADDRGELCLRAGLEVEDSWAEDDPYNVLFLTSG